MKLISRAFAVALCSAGALFTAQAQTYTENPDAGESPGTASGTASPSSPAGSSLTTIAGVLSSSTDADVFVIQITNFANFSATTVGLSLADTQLFLFTLSGMPLYTNDDANGMTLQSTLPSGHPLGPQSNGLYLLAISVAGYDPVDNINQLLFQDPPNGNTTTVRGPRQGVGPLAGFINGGALSSGSYSINLNGAAAAVPEPSTFALIGAGGVLALAMRLRRRNGR